MRELVDRYVRSLKERDDHPEQCNDLGTLVCWLLEREGFTVLERAFKHEGPERRVSKGRAQFGIDLLAVREEGQKLVSYRLVLKRGDVRKWIPGDPGSMAADLWLAAQTKDHEGRYGVTPDLIKVVAVHNGDRDSEGLGTLIEGTLDDIRDKTSVQTEWWDAARLVDRISACLFGRGAADTSFLPPALQPFVRLMLDSLLLERGPQGSGFDLAALDLLIERRLALRATNAAGARIENAEELHRRVAELSLVASMVVSESTRVAGGSTLPALDSIERVLCGIMSAIGRLFTDKQPPAQLREDVRMLLALHVERASDLRRRLLPLLQMNWGLALPTDGEAINYSLRCLRLSGYLAVAGHAALANGDAAEARAFGEAVRDLWTTNEAACLLPITDDHLIELVVTWELWVKVGLIEDVVSNAHGVVERFVWARLCGLPLPGIWQRARLPMRSEDLNALVETRLVPRSAWSSSFNDDSSTILPAALYVSWRASASLPRDLLGGFDAKRGARAPLPQVWAPPDDAGTRWYSEGIEHDGVAHVLPLEVPDAEFARLFEQAATAIAPSTAARCGCEVVDRIAWKVSRTPPPMSVLHELGKMLEALRPAGTGSSDPQA